MKIYDIRTGVRKIRTKTALALTGSALSVGGLLIAVSMPWAANAASSTSYSLSGTATQVTKGVEVTSSPTTSGSVDLTVPAGTTVNDINELNANFQALNGTTCGGGSPRYAVETTSGNIFVYLGDYPNYTSCASGDTGNLLASTNPIVDTSQVGGTFYDTWAHAQTLVGGSAVTGISMVVDGGWLAPQDFLFSSLSINGTNISLAATKDSCKQNGWQTLTDINGRHFKNQGDCVSYFATGGKNLASGH